MKTRLLITLFVAGLAFVGCGSDKNADGTTDSNMVDTSMSATSADTAMTADTNMVDSTTMPMDTTMVQ